MYSPYQYNGVTTEHWQYRPYEIVTRRRLEWTQFASFYQPLVAGNALQRSVYQAENLWKFNGYGSSFQELRNYPQENHAYSVQRWNSHVVNYSNQNRHPHQSQTEASEEKLAVEPLIEFFLQNRFFYLPLKNTYKTYGFRPEDLKAVPEKYPKYFENFRNVIFFKPKIELCKAYCLGGGCSVRGKCCDIHLCIDFILDSCHNNKCNLEHNWKAEHNLRVFRNFHMKIESVNLNYLKALLCDKLLSFKSPTELKLCNEYDTRGCTNNKCLKLHICFKYLTALFEGNFTQNSCDSDYIFPKCMKNHDIKSNHNKKTLIIHKLSFNDTPWNLIKVIKNLVQTKNTDIFPAHWSMMDGMELFDRVQINPFSEEFQNIEFKFNAEGLIYRIVFIERIQNPFLWKAFKNKVEEMTAFYKNEEDVNIQFLYHGTKEYSIKKICAENVDWRMHGSNVGSIYGKGAYFSPYARKATNYCDKISVLKYIFMVRVAVGQICVGKQTMKRPPIYHKTNRAFDSTCDKLVNPQSIVKYDKQEYYPEYILTITKSSA